MAEHKPPFHAIQSTGGTFDPSGNQPRSLYVHVPFCRHRCGYCSFPLLAGRDDLIESYLQALAVEIGWLKRRPLVSTLYLGGGTPSHLNVEQLRRLFNIVRGAFEFTDTPEISVECNPNDLVPQTAECLADCGVNRISFGVQSLNDKKLQLLERDHRADDVCRAMALARDVTDNVSMDLIFAVGCENVDAWNADLRAALGLSPAHLSTYELTVEKGTRFWNWQHHGLLPVVDEDLKAKMFESAIHLAGEHGMRHYEISSFAAWGRECRHNQSYWDGGDYLAFGPGASRFVDGIRESNHRSTTTYLKRLADHQSPIVERERLNDRQRARERLVFGLRQIDGFSISDFRAATGFEVVDILGHSADVLLNEKLITITADRCHLTHRGVMLYDGLAARIMVSEG